MKGYTAQNALHDFCLARTDFQSFLVVEGTLCALYASETMLSG
jgi:hypothetical protein